MHSDSICIQRHGNKCGLHQVLTACARSNISMILNTPWYWLACNPLQLFCASFQTVTPQTTLSSTGEEATTPWRGWTRSNCPSSPSWITNSSPGTWCSPQVITEKKPPLLLLSKWVWSKRKQSITEMIIQKVHVKARVFYYLCGRPVNIFCLPGIFHFIIFMWMQRGWL